MLLHASRKNGIARVELSGAAWVPRMCAMYAKDSPSHCRNGRVVACQNRNTGQGVDGVCMADGGGRLRTRTAMLEKSWLPQSLGGADASFWPADVCLFIFSGLRASFCFWVRGLTLYITYFLKPCLFIVDQLWTTLTG